MGLFILDAVTLTSATATTTNTPGLRPGTSTRNPRATTLTNEQIPCKPSGVTGGSGALAGTTSTNYRHPARVSTTAEDSDPGSDAGAKEAGKVEREVPVGKSGEKAEVWEATAAGTAAAVANGTGSTSEEHAGVTPLDDDSDDGKSKHDRSKSQRKMYLGSSHVAGCGGGDTARADLVGGGARTSTAQEEDRKRKGRLPGKMVGWRTLPQDNVVRAGSGLGVGGGFPSHTERLTPRMMYMLTP